MTESEWPICDNPMAMFRFLTDRSMQSDSGSSKNPRHPGERKLRLWVCATARLFGNYGVGDERSKVLDACEAIADGQPSLFGRGVKGLLAARKSIDAAWGWVWCATCDYLDRGVHDTLIQMRGNAGSFYRQGDVTHLLRDVVGNPFLPQPALTKTVYCDRCNGKGQRFLGKMCGACEGSGKTKGNADWLTPDAVSLVNDAYKHKDFSGLPIIADALEEEGCQDQHLLMHLQGWVPCLTCKGTGKRDCKVDAGYGNPLMTKPGWEHCYVCNDHGKGPHPGWHIPRDGCLHARGCWAVDLISGRS